MNKKVSIPLLCILMLLCTTCFCFGATSDLALEREFDAPSKNNMKYDAPQKIKEGGKTYKLKSIDYEIIKDNTITITKQVTTNDKEKYPEKMDYELASGKSITLTAKGNISWNEIAGDGVIKIQEYKSKGEIPSSIEGTKADVNGEVQAITLALTSTERFNRTENFSAPATFYAPVENGRLYVFDGKTITLSGNDPIWTGYQQDVKSYLGLNGNTYSVTGGKWIDDYTKSGDGYVRHASFTGTKQVPLYRATFVETDDTAKAYTAEITYSGVDPDMQIRAKAIMVYERSYIKEIAASAIAVLAIAIAAILFFVKRKKKSESEV